MGARRRGKFFAFFFVNFKSSHSIEDKIYILFTNWGNNMHFSPFFHPLSIIFFPQHVIWPYFLGGKQKDIHPCRHTMCNEILNMLLLLFGCLTASLTVRWCWCLASRQHSKDFRGLRIVKKPLEKK